MGGAGSGTANGVTPSTIARVPRDRAAACRRVRVPRSARRWRPLLGDSAASSFLAAAVAPTRTMRATSGAQIRAVRRLGRRGPTCPSGSRSRARARPDRRAEDASASRRPSGVAGLAVAVALALKSRAESHAENRAVRRRGSRGRACRRGRRAAHPHRVHNPRFARQPARLSISGPTTARGSIDSARTRAHDPSDE